MSNKGTSSQMAWATRELSPTSAVLTLLLVLLGGVLLSRSQWRQSPRHTSRATPAVPKCFRIQEIPDTMTKSDLSRLLVESIPSLGSQHATGLRLTYANSFHRYYTATFVSTEEPRSLEYPIDSSFFGITPLFDAKDATTDIVAVHGLGSHAIGGFKSKDNINVWLRDFLPEDVPNIRILVYSYDSAVTDKDNKISIAGLGKTFLDSYKTFRDETNTRQRPIIFIGHSLGGLLIKEALSMAVDGIEDPANSDFFKSSFGIMFFGVPNLGLRFGKLEQITAGQLNNQLIHDLELDSESEPTPYLRVLQDKFISCHRKQQPPLKIVSFYEQKKTATVTVNNLGKFSRGGDPCFMVTQESACRIGFEDNAHNRSALPSDHSSLVKFPNKADESYRIVQGKLKDLAREAPGVVDGRFQSNIKLSDDEKRHWDDLNVPDYRAFKENKEKLPKPVEGTLQWLVQIDATDTDSASSDVDASDSDVEDSEFEDTCAALQPFHADSLQKEHFKKWLECPDASHLIVTGPPGQGKSVLSNFVVNYLQHSIKNGNKVIYYFCNIKDESSRDSSVVLRALIVQLCEDQRLFRKLSNRFQDVKERRAFHSAHFDDLWRTFDNLVEASPYHWVYCVIDGLDVYEKGMEDLVVRLQTMIETPGHNFKLFATSRPTGPLGCFATEKKRALRPPRTDVELFVEKQVQSLPNRYDNLKDIIRGQLLAHAEGTFLWMDIVFRKIQKLPYPSIASVQNIIHKTPQELHSLYETLVREAFRYEHNIAILAWVAFAKQRLSLVELETGVAVMLTRTNCWAECCKEKTYLDRTSVQENLGTLIDIINDRLFLIHQSLLDFLTDNSAIWQEEHLGLKLQRPAAELGNACMTFLGFSDRSKSLSFNHHAESFWYKYIESAEDVDDMEKLECVLSRIPPRIPELSTAWIFALEKNVEWLATLLMDLDNFSDTVLTSNHLLIASATISPKILSVLLQRDKAPKFEVTSEVTQAAAMCHRGKEPMEVLLELRGDEIQITPKVLEEAAKNSFYGDELVRLLLERRSNEIQITPEIVAAAAGNSSHGREILELFLERGGNEIQILPEVVAAAAGNRWQGKEILDLLLERRANDIQITPEVITAAAGNNMKGIEILGLLLERRANDIQITPELIAAAAGNERQGTEILEFLLERRANGIQITPEVIKAAAAHRTYEGPLEILKLLLKRRTNDIQITPEVIAAAQTADILWRADILKLLLEHTNKIQVSPEVMIKAQEDDDTHMFAVLLRMGGNGVQITPEVVMEAATNSYSFALSLLLGERGDEVRITPEVVIAAAKAPSIRNIELLLEKRRDEVIITPELITAAAGNHNMDGLALLLEKRWDEIQITPEVAGLVAGNGNSERLRLLLEKRRD